MNALNAFVRHHREWIDFGYSCFDRMVLRAFVQPFYYLGHVVNFFRSQRHVTELTPTFFRRTSASYRGGAPPGPKHRRTAAGSRPTPL
jgi:hypothetical protein